ncbi:MAG: RNase adapter RapZ [Clostridia bacterium]|nr:RNase adapter RapZ [Clostridia bacterium]MBR1704977.1 RNase adapter RapZ [Clostridia bacterium]
MEFLIVTGLSGAGKSKAVEMLEDIDFVCIDNMPPKLLPAFGQIVLKSPPESKFAVVIDARIGAGITDFASALDELINMGVPYKLLFIDCEDPVLVNRFKETRRRHPLANEYNQSIHEAIGAEREMIAPFKQRADFSIDTTYLSAKQLKDRIAGLFLGSGEQTLRVQCMSFGFKFGLPSDADLVFDVRCLPNPFYVPELKAKTGLDKEVSDYVMEAEESVQLLEKLQDLVDFSLPLYREEGKSELIIAFGCTGGKHRSVTFAEAMSKHLRDRKVFCNTIHRDIQKK